MFWKKEKYTFVSDATRAKFLKNVALEFGENTHTFFASVAYPFKITRLEKDGMIEFLGADGRVYQTHKLKSYHRQYFKKVVDPKPKNTTPEPEPVESLESLINKVSGFCTIRVAGREIKNANEMRKILTQTQKDKIACFERRGKLLQKQLDDLNKDINTNNKNLAAMR